VLSEKKPLAWLDGIEEPQDALVALVAEPDAARLFRRGDFQLVVILPIQVSILFWQEQFCERRLNGIAPTIDSRELENPVNVVVPAVAVAEGIQSIVGVATSPGRSRRFPYAETEVGVTPSRKKITTFRGAGV
jgi:hypothetical protein